MARILLENCTTDFPIYNSQSRSLKLTTMNMLTGGAIGERTDGKVVVRAIDNISFEINEGDRVALLGHNGAGKSTMLRVLAGVYKPSKGKAIIEGEVSSLIDINLGIDREFTGRKNIYIRGIYLGLSKKEIDAKIDEIIEFSELGEFIDLPMRTYSSGMQMRLAFSVVMILTPEIILMDEWLSVGDAEFVAKADAKLNEIVDRSKILVIATHSKDRVIRSCNRAIWMEHGKVRLDGPAEEVVAEYWKQ